MVILANLFSGKYGRSHKEASDSQPQHSISFQVQLGRAPTIVQDRISQEGDSRRPRNYWHFLCYFLHAFLVLLYLVLLVAAASHHAEHQVTVPSDEFETFTIRLSVGLQAFHTFYTAVLVFVTQRLMLAAIFSSPKKLTHIHDICGAWAGFGAALSVLWQQTKVASSVLSVILVTIYFTCISVLHITSSTLVRFQFFNQTMTSVSPLLGAWPNASVDLASLDWMAMTPLLPFLQNFYDNETIGLVNDTLYDIPLGFLAESVRATTLNAHCGLLTNLSINTSEHNAWNVNSSMSGLGAISIVVPHPPLLNEIWFSPSIECLGPICSTFILYLISAGLAVDDSVGSSSHVYINGTYHSSGEPPQNFSTPIYFVACSLNTTNHTISLDISPSPSVSFSKQPPETVWSAFWPTGDMNLTSAISFAIKSANSLPPSPYCQPIMSYSALWANITAINAYMRSAVGMGVSPCYGTPFTQYASTPALLTRDQMESAVSQIAAEFVWLAGQLGVAEGGFDRQVLEYETAGVRPLWSLNINTLPVIFALCASIILLTLVVWVLWRSRSVRVSGPPGVLEIMWFGSCSRALRDHMNNVQTTSPDGLRASAMFETVSWSCTPSHKQEEIRDRSTVTSLCDRESCFRDPQPLELSGSEPGNSHLTDVPRSAPLRTSNISHATRRWCYALHVVLVFLHITLLALLVHHPEQSVVISYESSTMTIGLSALLQATYTLYTSVLIVLMQRLALLDIISQPQKLTTVHDVSGAWTGIGAAIHILWKQHKASSSIWRIIAVVAYLTMMLVLHIASSSVMGWELFIPVGVIQMDLAMPDSTVNISQLAWTEIFPVARLLEQDTGLLPTLGLQNSTLYDVSRVLRQGGTFPTGLINVTTFSAQCGVVPNVSLSQSSEGVYEITFQDGSSNGSFLEPPIWKDVVYAIAPTTECTACPQTLFYLITTGIHVNESVHDPVVIELNWTYTPPGGSPQNSTTLAYIAACSLSAQTVLVPASDPFGDQAPSPTSTSWSVWSPEDATNLGLGMAAALSKDTVTSYPMFFQGNSSVNFTDMDRYIMSSLGLNLSYANTTSVSQSSADPSVTLSPSKLENVLARTAAMFLWTAGQLGENWGGFDPPLGESEGTSDVQLWCLHLNTIPVIVASVASFFSLVLAIIIIGRGPSREHHPSVSGTSVLECLWLEARSELLHSHLQTVEEPDLDTLRAVGMFEICLGDVGLPNYLEEKPQIPELAGE